MSAGPEALDLPTLRFMAHKVAQVHGDSHPDMVTLAPIVDRLVGIGSARWLAEPAVSGVNPAPEQALEPLLIEARRLTTSYQPWEGSCGTVRRLFEGLAKLDKAL
jgi:iron-sulfur cluster repair protein YtfE (RIC family)